ncbi:dihydrofolate reductase family protein [Actinocorallia populi]|uniref:dihydrofolate reductase family protein n=1 Tax=Actinocorallia populi TaxID=2079200 RepID=UPI001E2A1D79|nr:dihydrofolate reductase family protein [Actinocorallia populi]
MVEHDEYAEYRYPEGPWLRANMIASVDGAAARDGLSGGLGNEADRRLFHRLRELADVVLVGAGTVRAEGYGAARVPLAVVSRTLGFDYSSPLFEGRTILVTTGRAPGLAEARAHAEVIVAGENSVDHRSALAQLRERGLDKVLCEGGPALLGQLVAEGLLDELCLTVSPVLLGGGAMRVLDGPAVSQELALASVRQDGDHLFLRYRRR